MHRSVEYILHEITIRIGLLATALYLSSQNGREPSVILPEEWWRYKHPEKQSTMDVKTFITCVFLISISIILISYSVNRNNRDLAHSLLALSMGILLTSIITDLIKVSMPRPRPYYFICCFPDGQMQDECTGDPRAVNEGRKSFPSGHTSYAFVNMTFLYLYLSAKLNLFNELGKGESWRMCVCLGPVIMATMVGVFRTAKNQHHPEDVIAGGIIGTAVAYVCYRQHYPSVYDPNPGEPYYFEDDPFDQEDFF